METLLSPVDNPVLFFALLLTLLVILAVSTARFFERAGYWLPNLTARNPLPRGFVILLVVLVWLYLSYAAFSATIGLGFMGLFGGSIDLLLYALLTSISYIFLTILTFYWFRGGLVSASIMVILIFSLSAYLITYKIGWVCKPLAEGGISIANGCLARAYEYPGGKGLPVDAKKMRVWYAYAASAGDSEAAYLVAIRNRDLNLLKQAAEDGHIKAAHRYSVMIKDPDVSLKWLTYAAEHGHADALFDLGSRYRTGKGVKGNITKTRELWIQAAEAGSLRAMIQLSTGYEFKNSIFERDLKLAKEWEIKTVNRKNELEHNWLKTNASMQEPPYDRRLFKVLEPLLFRSPIGINGEELPDDHPETLKKLAKIYLNDQSGDEALRQKALEIYRELGRQRDIKVQYELAKILLLQGDTPEHEQEEGRRWLINAAERNYEKALRKIIDAHEKGKYGFPIDNYEAIRFSRRLLRIMKEKDNNSFTRSRKKYDYWHHQALQKKIDFDEREEEITELKKAANKTTTKLKQDSINQDDLEAQFQLAHKLMLQGKREESFLVRKQAADNGHADAQYLEARSIMLSGLQKQYANKALDYYHAAARQNHPGALAALGDIYRTGNRPMNIEVNLYLSRIYYQKTLSLTKGDTVYKHAFGNPSVTTSIPTEYIRKYMADLPDTLNSPNLDGLTVQEKEEKINNWYYNAIEKLQSDDKNIEALKRLNHQRNALMATL